MKNIKDDYFFNLKKNLTIGRERFFSTCEKNKKYIILVFVLLFCLGSFGGFKVYSHKKNIAFNESLFREIVNDYNNYSYNLAIKKIKLHKKIRDQEIFWLMLERKVLNKGMNFINKNDFSSAPEKIINEKNELEIYFLQRHDTLERELLEKIKKTENIFSDFVIQSALLHTLIKAMVLGDEKKMQEIMYTTFLESTPLYATGELIQALFYLKNNNTEEALGWLENCLSNFFIARDDGIFYNTKASLDLAPIVAAVRIENFVKDSDSIDKKNEKYKKKHLNVNMPMGYKN